MRVLVTGADGFVGRSLVKRLSDAPFAIDKLTLTDRAFSMPVPGGAETREGTLCDPVFLDTLLEPGFDLLFHLASVPGALAEREQNLGYQVNLLAPIALARGAAARKPGARFVFASSIAVYGDPGTETVTNRSPLSPDLSYGAHKLMTEIFLSDMARRGDLSAISLRLPGIVARPESESGHGSAFMSLLFHRIAAGKHYACPVPAESTCWWMSNEAAVNTLLHAAGFKDISQTVIQPPVLHASVGAVAQATARVTGNPMTVDWGDDQTLRKLFGAMPPLDASPAASLGFKSDLDLEMLAEAALSGVQP